MPRFLLVTLTALWAASQLATAHGSELRRLAPTGFSDYGATLFGATSSNSSEEVEFGYSVSLCSTNGTRMVVGAPFHDWDTASSDAGSPNVDGGGVFLYDYDGNTTAWKLSWFLPGDVGEEIGKSVSVSADGTRLAVRRYKTNPSYGEVYDIDSNGSATQVGGSIMGVSKGDTITLSPDGNRVALSSENYNRSTGRVEIFELDNNVWISMILIDGDNEQDRFGWITAFSASGNRIAISSPNYSNVGLSRRGLVRVFDYNGSTWAQTGSDLQGTLANDQFGFSMDLSGDGSTLVVGSPGSSLFGTNRGKLSIFKEGTNSAWVPEGNEIGGILNNDKFGRSVSISDSGSRIVGSSYLHAGQRGSIRLFDIHEPSNVWLQKGSDIDGETAQDRFGYGMLSVSMTGDGSLVASGSIWADNTNGESTGSVRVFKKDPDDTGNPTAPSASPSISFSSQPTTVPTAPTTPPTASTPSPTAPPSVATTASPTSNPTPSPTAPPSVATTPSPTLSAPITSNPTSSASLGKFSWTIERIDDGTYTFDGASSNQELRLDYNISRRDTNVAVFQPDCVTPVPLTVVDVITSLSPTSTSYGVLSVNLDIKQDAVVGSDIWSEGVGVGVAYINVCVRLELLLDDVDQTSVHFDETELQITIDMTSGFQATSIVLDRIDAGTITESVAIDYEIAACQCDETFTCINDVLTQGSDVYICLETNAIDVNFVAIESLSFTQGSLTSRPIIAGAEDALTAIDFQGSRCSIRSQMTSAFFSDTNPGNVLADGIAVMSFADGRARRLRTKFIHQRNLKENDVAGFDVNLGITSLADSPGTVAKSTATLAVTTVIGAFFLM